MANGAQMQRQASGVARQIDDIAQGANSALQGQTVRRGGLTEVCGMQTVSREGQTTLRGGGGQTAQGLGMVQTTLRQGLLMCQQCMCKEGAVPRLTKADGVQQATGSLTDNT